MGIERMHEVISFVGDSNEVTTDLKLKTIEPSINSDWMFGIEEDNSAELAAIILEIELTINLRIFLNIFDDTVMATDGRVI